ncbi:MAG: stage III sporulation protein AA [Lachnospiraceae bacterium]|nr:stage III sporulation protein AA [Lachnospiraceae bacterium]
MSIDILRILPVDLRGVLSEISKGFEDTLEEINVRVNKPVILRVGGENGPSEIVTDYVVGQGNIKEMLGFISNFSMYAYEEEVREGYITIKGGHRVGISGKIVMDDEKVKTIKNISSINIRVARQIKGCADEIINNLMINGFENTLIISPPCKGKTTLLREMVRLLSDRYNYKLGLVDERGEIAACHMGIPQNDVGIRTDVMDGCKKDKGITMLVRSMSPEIVAVDELGNESDVKAIFMAGSYGRGILATIHGNSVKSVLNKGFMKELDKESFFKKFIVIGDNRMARIFDEKGNCDGKIYRLCGDNCRHNTDGF